MKTRASFAYSFRLLFPRTLKNSNARRSLTGAFLCISVSLIPLVMVLTVSDGMIKGMTERMIGLSSSHLCAVLHPDVDETQSVWALEKAALKLSEAEGVKNVYPEIQAVGLASSSALRTGANIRAVKNDIFKTNTAFSSLFKIVESDKGIKNACDIVLEEGKNAVIGSEISRLLNVHAGQELRLITTRILPSNKIVPKITKFKVSAVVSSGYQELDALWVFIPLETGFSILPLRTSQIMCGIETQDAFSISLDKTLEKVETLTPPFTRIYRWNELNVSQYENFSSTTMMLLFIMLLIVLVASVNISSALVMLVMERRKEIAILKSLGASPSGISFSFLITGLVTGFAGLAAGIPAGLLCAVNFQSLLVWIERILTVVSRTFTVLFTGGTSSSVQIHILDPAFYLQDIPLSIPLGQLVIIALGTLILSVAAAAVPSIKAGREKPIESLKKL